MAIKWGLIGCGAHGARYLDPFNGGDGRYTKVYGKTVPNGPWERAINPSDVIESCDIVVIASPPASHAAYALRALEQGRAVLLEKPIALTRPETMAVIEASDRPGAPPLLVSSPHLFTRAFLALCGGPDSTVVWCGPERRDGSCDAYMDWSPHAWSMATALGTERVITGMNGTRMTLVMSGAREYAGQREADESPLRAQVETLERLYHGGFDWRAGRTFTRRVYDAVFDNRVRK